MVMSRLRRLERKLAMERAELAAQIVVDQIVYEWETAVSQARQPQDDLVLFQRLAKASLSTQALARRHSHTLTCVSDRAEFQSRPNYFKPCYPGFALTTIHLPERQSQRGGSDEHYCPHSVQIEPGGAKKNKANLLEHYDCNYPHHREHCHSVDGNPQLRRRLPY